MVFFGHHGRERFFSSPCLVAPSAAALQSRRFVAQTKPQTHKRLPGVMAQTLRDDPERRFEIIDTVVVGVLMRGSPESANSWRAKPNAARTTGPLARRSICEVGPITVTASFTSPESSETGVATALTPGIGKSVGVPTLPCGYCRFGSENRHHRSQGAALRGPVRLIQVCPAAH